MKLENELRIGNWVQYKDGDVSVIEAMPSKDVVCISGLTDSSINGIYELRFLQPIKLTEEWLIKFGFEKDENEFTLPKFKGFIKSYYDICVRCSKDFCDLVLTENLGNNETYSIILPQKLKYIHQLQNLYFALTGLELELKND